MARSLCRFAILVFALGLTSCGGGSSSDIAQAIVDQIISSETDPQGALKPANPDSPWADVLVDCVSAEYVFQSCSLRELSLIGMIEDNPSIDDVMDRLVVSHDWMAVRFRQLLERMPGDLLLLMRHLTAIVIDAEVRPSYYTTGTGAMYLDPDDLWLTASERDLVPTTADPRSSYDDELAFVSLWRYVDGYSYAWSSSRSAPRTLDDIELPMAALLFHELAHAADFFPLARFSLLDTRQSVYENANNLVELRLSNSVPPPDSRTLFEIADVMFFGETPTNAQKALDPNQIAAEFRLDRASDLYAYATQYEDFAMLVEEVMMYHHYGLKRDVAFTNRPPAGSGRSAYIVQWGMRHRAFDPTVRQYSEQALRLLFNQNNVSAYFPGDLRSELLDDGVSWDLSILTGSSVEKTGNSGDAAALDQQAPAPIARPYALFDPLAFDNN